MWYVITLGYGSPPERSQVAPTSSQSHPHELTTQFDSFTIAQIPPVKGAHPSWIHGHGPVDSHLRRQERHRKAIGFPFVIVMWVSCSTSILIGALVSVVWVIFSRALRSREAPTWTANRKPHIVIGRPFLTWSTKDPAAYFLRFPELTRR